MFSLTTDLDTKKSIEIVPSSFTFLDDNTISVKVNVNRGSRHRTFILDAKTLSLIHIIGHSPSNEGIDILSSQKRYYYSEWRMGGLTSELYCVTREGKKGRTIDQWLRQTVATSEGLWSKEGEYPIKGILHKESKDEVNSLSFLSLSEEYHMKAQKNQQPHLETRGSSHSHMVVLLLSWLEQEPEFDASRTYSLSELAHHCSTSTSHFYQQVFLLDVRGEQRLVEIKASCLLSAVKYLYTSVTNECLFTNLGVWIIATQSWLPIDLPGVSHIEATGQNALYVTHDFQYLRIYLVAVQTDYLIEITHLFTLSKNSVRCLRSYTVRDESILVLSTKRKSWYVSTRMTDVRFIDKPNVLWLDPDIFVAEHNTDKLVLKKST